MLGCFCCIWHLILCVWEVGPITAIVLYTNNNNKKEKIYIYIYIHIHTYIYIYIYIIYNVTSSRTIMSCHHITRHRLSPSVPRRLRKNPQRLNDLQGRVSLREYGQNYLTRHDHTFQILDLFFDKFAWWGCRHAAMLDTCFWHPFWDTPARSSSLVW